MYGVKHAWEGCVSGVKDTRGVIASMEPCFEVEKALPGLQDSRLSFGDLWRGRPNCVEVHSVIGRGCFMHGFYFYLAYFMFSARICMDTIAPL